MPPRYGRPPGFGGGYDDPARSEFQPGTEVGVVDPNINRHYTNVETVAWGARSHFCTGAMAGRSVYSATAMADTRPLAATLNGAR